MDSGAPKPPSIRWILIFGWLRLGTFAVISILGMLLISPGKSEILRGFRSGFIRASGFDPEQYGAYQAGQILGQGMVPALLTVLLIVFVHKRKLTALRITAIVIAVASLIHPAAFLITVPIVALAFTDSAKAWCLAQAGPVQR
jgi:hypothetical protein